MLSYNYFLLNDKSFWYKQNTISVLFYAWIKNKKSIGTEVFPNNNSLVGPKLNFDGSKIVKVTFFEFTF